MAQDRYLIIPKSGLQTNLKPWQILDDAFEFLQNAYSFRGRIRKRFGSLLMGSGGQTTSRLRIDLESGGAGIGITNGAGNAAGNVRTIIGDPGFPLNVGQIFSIGGQIYTVISAAAGVQPMLATQGSGTFNITTGDFTITGAPPLTAIFSYPSLPVMGIDQYEIGAVNNHPTYAFDTRYAYTFAGGAWVRSGTGVTPIWHGNFQNFFWVTNWQGLAGTQVLFVSNFNATTGAGKPGANDDPIWTFDGTTWVPRVGSSVTNGFFFRPSYGGPPPTPQPQGTGPFVQTARIILPFKNRLLLLNTIENDNANANGTGTATAYVNRLRYSFNGSPFARNAWYEPNTSDSSGGVVDNNNLAAGAGFIDASTEEQIIAAEFIKDRLIVYFERSTWEIAYTGNEILPFVWQKINTELGSQSTFSTVPFDKAVLGIGQTGVHACSGLTVERIDSKIPDEIFEFETANNATTQTSGIRDYVAELVYWTFVSDLETPTQTFPNQVLVYNYANGTWALNDDCITTFGYFEQSSGMTWASSAPLPWDQANFTWASTFIAPNDRLILAGTPEGFIFIVVSGQSDEAAISRNAPSMQITNMSIAATGIITLTIINHNFTLSGATDNGFPDYILLENIVADPATMAYLNGTIWPVNSIIDANTITINTNNNLFGKPPLTSGTYNGGGTVARVSNIQIQSKQFNPYVEEDRNVYLARVDFGVTKTVNGEITVDYYPSSTDVSMIEGGVSNGSIMGTSVLETKPYPINLYPLEQYAKLLWHPVYFQTTGQFVQLGMYFSPLQMTTPVIALEDFELQGMCLYTTRSSVRLQ